jgi:hypothetical protein
MAHRKLLKSLKKRLETVDFEDSKAEDYWHNSIVPSLRVFLTDEELEAMSYDDDFGCEVSLALQAAFVKYLS